MKKDYRNIIIAALILFITMNKLNSIESTLEYLNRGQDDLRREMSNIYSNVDEVLKKQASILDSYDVKFGDKLADDLTVPVNITVTPKENTENSTAELLINDERNPMTKSGTTFTTSINAYVFDPFQIKVVLNYNGTEKVETIDDYYNLQYKYLLEVHADYLGNYKYSSGKYQYDGDIVINTFGQSDNNLEKAGIIIYKNDEVLEEQEVDMHGNDSTMHSVKGEVELSANDRIEMYVNVQDKHGINYKYIVKADRIDSEGKLVRRVPEWTNGSVMEIKDKNGKVLLENNF